MTAALQDEQLQAKQQASWAVCIHHTTSATTPCIPDMTSLELQSGQGTYCHESGTTGIGAAAGATATVPPRRWPYYHCCRWSHRHTHHLVAYLCLHRRGHDYPTHLEASPWSLRYHSGSDIPHSLLLVSATMATIILRA